MRKSITYATILFVAGALTFGACKKKEDTMPTTTTMTKTLYERLGGNDAIKAVVDKFIEYVAADTAINSFFAETVAQNRVDALKMNLVNQIGEGTGGPEKYTGKSMADAHKGMNIQNDDFDALVGDLVKALDFYNVPEQEKGELLDILGPMRSDIVGK
ncbi:MAG: group 1 truncated hemoglobin [Chitinophagaceae bacterium]|nr:group 1 truncated hemoglobin [Chitinophagaceae bacterium]MCB9047302.1 group 1 truncated hemoglobin [Chitinophagales bacterium]